MKKIGILMLLLLFIGFTSVYAQSAANNDNKQQSKTEQVDPETDPSYVPADGTQKNPEAQQQLNKLEDPDAVLPEEDPSTDAYISKRAKTLPAGSSKSGTKTKAVPVENDPSADPEKL